MVRRSTSDNHDHIVGLRIVTQKQADSNLLVTSCLKLSDPPNTFRLLPSSTPDHQQSCFLKSCFLCSKCLSLDKDVYMYRGDQGFCSIECRNRQIYLDEMKEIEISTKKVLASFPQRHCGSNSSHRCETRALLEEIRHRHHRNSPCSEKDPVIFSYS